MLKDSFGRPIKDLRISVTDRCNFRCFYCKSARGIHYVERHRLLSYEEITRLVKLFAEMGVSKVRITGGEPLLRKNLESLIAQLGQVEGITDLALTTNGFNLFKKAHLLKKLGLDRVTISLDTLRQDRFREITQSGDFQSVLDSIQASQEAGLDPVKVNCVIVRGVNDDEIIAMAEFARARNLTVRFIEFMPIDEDENWSQDRVITGAEILEILETRFELIPLAASEASQTSRNYSFPDQKGAIGLIMPVSRPFCGECSRIRLTADGKIRTCLFSLVEHDIKGQLRRSPGDEDLKSFIRQTVWRKEAGHRINQPDFKPPSRSMSYIGG